MNKIVSFLFLPLFFLITSLCGLYLLEFIQEKKEYSNLNFIPDESIFVARIDGKELAKTFAKEWIESEENLDFSLKKSDTTDTDLMEQISSIDFSYPLYFFSKKVEDKTVLVTVIPLKNEIEFLNSIRKNQQVSKFVFTYNLKGFIVSNSSESSFRKIQTEIRNSNSTRWNSLIQSNSTISFLSKIANLKGSINFDKNRLVFSGGFENTYVNRDKFLYLKPNGFHISSVIPSFTSIDILKAFLTDSSMDWIKNIQSVSINYQGLQQPYFPKFQLLINAEQQIDVNEVLSNYSLGQLEESNTKLKIAGMKFNYYQDENKFIYIGSTPYSATLIEKSNLLMNIKGDPKIVVNFDEAPMMKMLFLLNPQFAELNKFISNVENVSCRIIPDNKLQNCSFQAELELKKSNKILVEIVTLMTHLY